MRKKASYTAVIIGAGRIASSFDSPDIRDILTHAHAYQEHPRTSLLGFFDTDASASLRAARRWRSRSLSWRELEMLRPDIISVCVPDAEHYPMLLKLMRLRPKLVVSEKPLTTRLAHARHLARIYLRHRIPVLVNYSYLFDSAIQHIKKLLDTGRSGRVLAAYGIYSKGLLHNGSHVISLARYLFGDLKESHAHHRVRDYSHSDPTIGGFLSFKKCPQFHLIACDEKKYSLFEFDVLLEKGRFRLFDAGMKLSFSKVSPDATYAGYRSLKLQYEKAVMRDALLRLIDNGVRHLDAGSPLICDITDAYEIQRICGLLKDTHSV